MIAASPAKAAMSVPRPNDLTAEGVGRALLPNDALKLGIARHVRDFVQTLRRLLARRVVDLRSRFIMGEVDEV